MRRRIIKNRNLKDYSCFTGGKTSGCPQKYTRYNFDCDSRNPLPFQKRQRLLIEPQVIFNITDVSALV
jgi:hypothetical protein